MSDTYLIPAVNMEPLQQEIEKLNKRANKLKCKPIELTVIDQVVKTHYNQDLKLSFDEIFFKCSINGETPKLAGWKLIAALEPLEDGMIVREVPHQVCPTKFRDTKLTCDHCGYTRRRNAIFVLQNENGEYKQVGRQCIKDFLGGVDPKDLLNSAENIFRFCKLCKDAETEEMRGAGRFECAIDLERFVSVVAIIIRRIGWAPRGENPQASTANTAFWVCTEPSNSKDLLSFIRSHNLEAQDCDIELSKKAIQWALSLPDDSSTYLYNVKLCCKAGYVTAKTCGYVASLINAYQRAVAIEIKPKVDRRHLGEINSRQIFENVKINSITQIDSYFPKTLVKFTDPEGNVLVWFASSQPDWVSIGHKFNIKATVEKHDDYKGIPQTKITRVKCEKELVEV